MVTVLIIFAIFLLLNVVFGLVIALKTTHPKTLSIEEESGEQLSSGFDAAAFCKNNPHEDFTLFSKDGNKIHYSVFPCSMEDGTRSRRTVVLAHGYNGNRMSLMSYAKMFIDKGFNCVVFDQRNHGFNEKSFTSLGFYEESDLRAVLEDAKGHVDMSEGVGLFGISMGAATCLLAMNKIPGLRFVIEDSGYSSFREQVKDTAGHVPVSILFLSMSFASIFLRLFYGIRMGDVDPAACVKNASPALPILFIHSRSDRKVLFRHHEILFPLKKGAKTDFTAEGVNHIELIFKRTEEYKGIVSAFLDSVFASNAGAHEGAL